MIGICAACCSIALVFASVPSLFLAMPFIFLESGIDKRPEITVMVDWVKKQIHRITYYGLRYQYVPALCALLTGVILKEICVFDVCVCMFYFRLA